MSADGFLSRWSRRKAEVKAGREAPIEPVAERETPTPVRPEPFDQAQDRPVEGPGPAVPPSALAEPVPEQRPAQAERGELPHVEASPALTLDDVHTLKPGDEISRFVARGVDETVKRAAVKKLFADPHFNIMDGLDIYIDDYSRPDPIPMAMLRQLNQAKFMNLFAAEEAAEEAEAAAANATAAALDPTTPAQDAGEASMPEAAVPHADENADLQLQPDDPARREAS